MWEFLISIFNPVQLIGYVGTTCSLVSYQCKKNRSYFVLQTACSIAFTIQFIFLGSWAGLLHSAFCMIRAFILSLDEKYRKNIFLFILLTCFGLSSVISYWLLEEQWWIAILLFVAQCGGTLAMWSRNGKTIRMAQLFCISPIWMINNIYYGSIGGVISESCNIISVLVSFVRFRKTGYDKT